jgi:hypothetical protein
VSNRDLTIFAQIPGHIVELWGKPPVAAKEDLAAYNKLSLAIASNVRPADLLEWLWIKDILELTWESRRLRAFKAELIDYEFRREYNKHGDMVFSGLGTYEKLDSLLAFAEARRNAALREIERHRESLAFRLRKASDDIIDGEFSEPAARAADAA